ncbi:MAG: gamma-glutamyltransferase [Acidobacteriota bacterium]
MRKIIGIIVILLFLIPDKVFCFKKGVVASDSEIASRVGIEILKKGGNAVDAAVAVGFALAVTFPPAGNIGGGGFMLIRMADGKVFLIDYREKAPKKAHRDMYLDEKGEVIENLSTEGFLAIGVPGTVAGLTMALEKCGTLKLEDVIKPSIELAEKGFKVNKYLEESLKRSKHLSKNAESKKIFLNNGNFYKEGDLLIQKDLAKTLKAISKKGKTGFYSGKVASKIEADMRKNGGFITKDDLLSYEAKLRNPIRFKFRNYEIITPSPPSSGAILVEILNILENFKLNTFQHNSAEYIHIVTEAMKLAFRDRAKFMGDPDFVNIPLRRIISKEYAFKKAQEIKFLKAMDEKESDFGDPFKESEETTHFSVADQWGNVVSNTYTLNGGYGSGVTIKGTGVLMNNEMDDFCIKPNYPNIYGLIGGEENSIQPEKRMLSSMVPSIILKDDKPFLALGSPGGPTIINTVAQVILNLLDFKMTIENAVLAPRFHHQWIPNQIVLEEGKFSDIVLKELEKRGHKISFRKRLGDVQAIIFNGEEGEFYGFSDPRGPGKVAGCD